MTIRMYLVFEPREMAGLLKLADMHLRSPREQLRAILQAELRQNGLLDPRDDRNSDKDSQDIVTDLG